MKAGGVPGREKEKNSVKERETSDYSAASREHVTMEFQSKSLQEEHITQDCIGFGLNMAPENTGPGCGAI